MEKDLYTKIGSWAFLIGILIALLVGLYTAYTIEDGENFLATETGGWVVWLLVIIGAIVGIISFIGKGTITAKEGPGFLIAGIALLVMAPAFWGMAVGANAWITGPWIGALLAGISMCLAIFVAPAVGLLAIKAIWKIGKDV
jgi:hypothetical protein